MNELTSAAVLIDAGFVWKIGRRILGREWTPDDIIAMSRACLKDTERLFRIFFYDCLPFDGKREHPISKTSINYRESETHQKRTAFLKSLSERDYIAFRKGRLSHKGWRLHPRALEKILAGKKERVEPDDIVEVFQQKRVDMKIGLDVAWMSSKRLVDKIILIGSDTDYIPAMKHARREGAQVIIVGLPNQKNSTRPDMNSELMEHADECRLLTFDQGFFACRAAHAE